MKVLAFTGWSGSGKTTLIAQVIRELVANGARVAAIKHTHHAIAQTGVSVPHRGDTAIFENAGADPVLLAGNVDDPRDLLAGLDVDYVLIEGFKSYHGWPRIEVTPEARPRPADVLAKLATIADLT